MSREIKFRAWDKETNIMVYSDHRTRKLYDVYYGFEMNGEGELECRWEGEFTESHVLDGGMLDNLMQYTGLKDMNGVEIYEGDILQSEHYFRYQVVFKGDCWRCEPLKNKGFKNRFIGRDLKIIGNIYENPELLKEE